MNSREYIKNAELATEATYNHIDGVLGNDPVRGDAMDLTDGQTHEEMRELAPETLPEEKQSIAAQLQEWQTQALAQSTEQTGQVDIPYHAPSDDRVL